MWCSAWMWAYARMLLRCQMPLEATLWHWRHNFSKSLSNDSLVIVNQTTQQSPMSINLHPSKKFHTSNIKLNLGIWWNCCIFIPVPDKALGPEEGFTSRYSYTSHPMKRIESSYMWNEINQGNKHNRHSCAPYEMISSGAISVLPPLAY